MSMSQSNDVPQIISIVPVDGNGKISLKKEAKEYLGSDKGLRLALEDEAILRVGGAGDDVPVKGGRLAIPGVS